MTGVCGEGCGPCASVPTFAAQQQAIAATQVEAQLASKGQVLQLQPQQAVGAQRPPHRLLHAEEGQDLQQVVLDHVAHNAVLVKVAAAPLGAKVLREDDLGGRRRAAVE